MERYYFTFVISDIEHDNRKFTEENRLLHKGNAESRTACPFEE